MHVSLAGVGWMSFSDYRLRVMLPCNEGLADAGNLSGGYVRGQGRSILLLPSLRTSSIIIAMRRHNEAQAAGVWNAQERIAGKSRSGWRECESRRLRIYPHECRGGGFLGVKSAVRRASSRQYPRTDTPWACWQRRLPSKGFPKHLPPPLRLSFSHISAG